MGVALNNTNNEFFPTSHLPRSCILPPQDEEPALRDAFTWILHVKVQYVKSMQLIGIKKTRVPEMLGIHDLGVVGWEEGEGLKIWSLKYCRKSQGGKSQGECL